MKNILLLYKGYPRMGQIYQIDEAKELRKKHNIMIISWDWKLEDIDETAPPYFYNHPNNLLDEIRNFKPDIIHTHFLDSLEIVHNLCSIFNINFTIRTHSFDIINNKLSYFNKYKPYLLSEYCLKIITFPGYFNNKFKELDIPDNKILVNYPQINIKPFIDIKDIPNGDDIMGCGSFLKKKNIQEFIIIAKQIKNIFPNKNITYYGVKEGDNYFNIINKFNIDNGSPVIFKTIPHDQMPYEYKKHQWIIYPCCRKLLNIGYPLAIAEAQLSGVGVILYKVRDDMEDFVSENGYLYTEIEQVINIIKNNFDGVKRQNAINLYNRYNIENNISQLENIWNLN
jgi:glycosyltransferase involved in cell wall biosynthesis